MFDRIHVIFVMQFRDFCAPLYSQTDEKQCRNEIYSKFIVTGTERRFSKTKRESEMAPTQKKK